MSKTLQLVSHGYTRYVTSAGREEVANAEKTCPWTFNHILYKWGVSVLFTPHIHISLVFNLSSQTERNKYISLLGLATAI